MYLVSSALVGINCRYNDGNSKIVLIAIFLSVKFYTYKLYF